ncbi:hypothetical protein ACFSCX_06005 [Bacillus salitolerans]|uniref:Uncharacterized protein n=1 Tax=Bacillus salitolerans TaxID=1437434 RepID=A0ABW4LLT9_9BACI
MPTLKEILHTHELELVKFYQNALLEVDIEDEKATYSCYEEMGRIIATAKARYYKENPSILSMKKKSMESNNPQDTNESATVRDLLTDEEKEEIEFLQWRITKAMTPVGVYINKKKIDKIIEKVKRRDEKS